MVNHHNLLYPFSSERYLYEYCTGGKTGYTVMANSTLVTYAQKDGLTLACVVMNAQTPDHFTDTIKLCNYCFDNYKAVNIAQQDPDAAGEAEEALGLLNDNPPFVTLDPEAYVVIPTTKSYEDVTSELDTETAGDDYATLRYSYDGRRVGSASLVASGASIGETVFDQAAPAVRDAEDEIVIRPVYLLIVLAGVLGVILLIMLIRLLVDRVYILQSKLQRRKEEKARFGKIKKKRYRKKDRLFR